MQYNNIKGKYLNFLGVLHQNKKTWEYGVVGQNDGSNLGVIKWFPRWRKYCFFPQGNCTFDAACLKEIQDIMDLLMEDRDKDKAYENPVTKAYDQLVKEGGG